MRTISVLIFAAAISSPAIANAAADAPIREILARVAHGYATFNAREVADCYTGDAIWQNPFGVRLKGRDQIEKFLTGLFQRPGFRSAKDTAPYAITDIRMLNSTTATAWSEEASKGQVDLDGKAMAPRKSHYLEVFVLTPKGWRITDDMIMDEK